MLELAEVNQPIPADGDIVTPYTDTNRNDVVEMPAVEQLEAIGSYLVHPMASMFPLITGKEYDEFVESIRMAGRISEPLEVHEGLLISGRNRLRAAEALRSRGVDIEVPVIEWQPRGAETVEEHIYAVNVHRRHLTDDQRAALATKMLPKIRAARAAKQSATRFGAGSRNTVDPDLVPPKNSQRQTRSNQEKVASSSVGQLAALAKVSRHKAEQAVVLADKVAIGALPEAVLTAVAQGQCRLRDAVPAGMKSRRPKAVSLARSAAVERTAADGVPADALVTEVAGDRKSCLRVTPAEIRGRWEWFKAPFAAEDHAQLRTMTAEIIAVEQRASESDMGRPDRIA